MQRLIVWSSNGPQMFDEIGMIMMELAFREMVNVPNKIGSSGFAAPLFTLVVCDSCLQLRACSALCHALIWLPSDHIHRGFRCQSDISQVSLVLTCTFICHRLLRLCRWPNLCMTHCMCPERGVGWSGQRCMLSDMIGLLTNNPVGHRRTSDFHARC